MICCEMYFVGCSICVGVSSGNRRAHGRTGEPKLGLVGLSLRRTRRMPRDYHRMEMEGFERKLFMLRDCSGVSASLQIDTRLVELARSKLN